MISCKPDAACSAMGCLEATGGFEPPNRAFAELRLNHLATSPRTILPRFWCRGGDLNSYGFAPTAPSRPRVYQFHHLGTAPDWGLAGVGGLEPPTCGFGDRCSSQLSYTPALPTTGPAGAPQCAVRDRTKLRMTHARSKPVPAQQLCHKSARIYRGLVCCAEITGSIGWYPSTSDITNLRLG